MKKLVLSFGVVGLACSSGSTPPTSDACTLDYSGNFDASVSATACASSGKTGAGDYLLLVDTTSASGGRLQVSIDLGAKPTEATFTSDAVTSWTAIDLGYGGANCVFSAGGASVPAGSFTLTLDAVPDAGAPHGELTLVMYVQAPPGVDCGPRDQEDVHVAF